VGTRCANHVTPLYPQKLALTSPTGGGRSVGMVRSRTKATEFGLVMSIERQMFHIKFIILFLHSIGVLEGESGMSLTNL